MVYKGIDERIIKCSCENKDCMTGISFDEDEGKPTLRFHFLDYVTEKRILCDVTKSMFLDKATTKQLIGELQKLKF